jgi:fatty-acyl-CoA synthase
MHFADLLEALSDVIGDREALVCGDQRRSWREFDDRAARLSSAFMAAGVKPDTKIGFYLYNGNEYIEAYYATLKVRGVAVNINYRYVEQELKYLLEYSDTEVLIYHSSLADRVASVASELKQLKLLVEVDNGGGHYDQAVAYEQLISQHPPAERIARSGDDAFMNFTGGTTGLPKGVVYRIGDVTDFMAQNIPSFYGLDEKIDSVADLTKFAQMLTSSELPPASLPACPLMHTAGLMNGVLPQLLCGAKITTLAGVSFDAVQMLKAIEAEKITFTVIVGNAFCLPILQALDDAKARGESYDLSSLKMIMSSGVVWSPDAKRRMLEYGDFQLIDAMGATEGGMGMSISNRQSPPSESGKFNKMPSAKVFTEEGVEVQPGSGEVGYIAAGGAFVPIAYYKDPEKSAKTFRVIDGKRYAFIGDMGTVEADGSLKVMGRGSGCINTAGEKVFPEEIETVLRSHPAIDDCLVMGIADERFGQKVAAIVATGQVDSSTEQGEAEAFKQQVIAFCKEQLAAYKCPRVINIQADILRGANGKVDYGWARALLESNA